MASKNKKANAAAAVSDESMSDDNQDEDVLILNNNDPFDAAPTQGGAQTQTRQPAGHNFVHLHF